MPVSWTAVFRVVVVLLMAAHVFYLYAFASTLQEIVGLDLATVVASASFALVMLVPLAPASALPELPEILRAQLRRRRWSEGRCPRCGYFVANAAGSTCPECGADRGEPPTFRFGWATARRFAALALAAWLVGCVAAESWASFDEANFNQEARARLGTGGDGYSRPRWRPMQHKTLYYSPADGVTAYPPEFVVTDALREPPEDAAPETAGQKGASGRRW